MELTREQLEKLANPTMLEATYAYKNCFVAELAKQLLAEMDKPKVWDGAPVNAGIAQVVFSKTAKEPETIWSKLYRRETKKTRARQIAEEYADKWDKCDPSISGMSRADTIERAIKEAMESVK